MVRMRGSTSLTDLDKIRENTPPPAHFPARQLTNVRRFFLLRFIATNFYK